MLKEVVLDPVFE